MRHCSEVNSCWLASTVGRLLNPLSFECLFRRLPAYLHPKKHQKMQQQLQREIDGSYGRTAGSQPTDKKNTRDPQNRNLENNFSSNYATGRRTRSLVQDDDEMIQM